ncbi:Carotenoid 9,10(9',10')-cleavage dioxygenase 1 [Glycine max]|nr:Carotenoid 9,10(9',10')-cleavage dioxygenase 1 [Glycine max]
MGDDGKKMSGEGGIVKVEPKPSNGFTSKVVDLLEKLVVKFLYDSSLTHHYLTGNFAPVPETPPTKDLPVKGYLPGKIVVFCTNINYPGFWRAAAARQPQLWLRLSAISSNIEEGDETATLKLCFVVFLEIADKCSHNSGRKHPKNLDTMAEVMDCLNGEFVRVGPNPKFSPVAGYHWFDGDGMIHGLRIKDGKATYVSRFVRTSRLKQEEYFGGSKFMKIGDLKGLFGLLMVNIHMLRTKWKVLDVSYGTGTANTALVYHHGKLLALSEADKPYAIKVFEDGDLQTLGMLDYDKRLGHSFTAHPKVDPFTGEAILK